MLTLPISEATVGFPLNPTPQPLPVGSLALKRLRPTAET